MSFVHGNTPTSKISYSGTAPISAAQYDSIVPWIQASVGASLTKSEARTLLAELCGDIPAVVSVPNMLLELPQTLNLWHDLKRPLLELMSSSTARAKWKSGSNALLSQQFGFFPLVGDIQKLITSKRTVHEELKKILKQQSGQRLTKTIRRIGATGTIGLSATSASYSMVANSAEINAYASVHALTRIGRYLDCSDPGVVSAMGRALYGWNRPLDTLWEATPFSFVGDWFFPIGDYLHGLQQSVFGGRMQIVSLCTTSKMTASAAVQRHYTLDNVQKTTGCGTIHAAAFQRTLGIGVAGIWDELTIPNVKQVILGGALILQK